MNEDRRNLPIEPDLEASLEARLVALVLGEASDFETEELQRLMQERPELAAFKREMEQVTQLLHEVGQSDIETPHGDWKLPSERRQAVLDVIHGRVATSKNSLATAAANKLPRSRWRRFEQAGLAFVAIATMVVMIGLMLPAVQMSRESARRLSRAESMEAPNSWKSKPTPTSEPSSSVTLNSTESRSSYYMEREPSNSESPVADSRQNPADALSAIHNSLRQLADTSALEPAGNGPVSNFDVQAPDPTMAGNERLSRYSINGRDASDGMGDGGMPSGGQRDTTEIALGQSAPAKPGSPSAAESLDLPMDMKNETGQVEKKLADMDGEAFRSIEGQETNTQLGGKSTRSIVLNRITQKPGDLIDIRKIQEHERLLKSSELFGDQPGPTIVIRPPDDEVVEEYERLKQSREQWQRDSMARSAGLNETNAATEAFSTFSLHVSDVSFKLAAAALARGEWPEAAKIRIEEFVNAFDYRDPLPGANEKVACVVEQAIHPFIQQRNVLRVSMRTSAEGRAEQTPLRLTLVLDNSGSMERIDRQQAVRRAFTLLAQQLSANDQVTLISFAGQPRLLAENVAGSDSGKLVELISQLPSEGGTNIEAALKLAFEKAAAQQSPGVQSRIVLLTDGAVNLGNADPESLSRMVETMRTAGIAFDAAGISADGLNDEVLEALTRKGDGRYYLLDAEESSSSRFAQQIAGALRPSASNVKVQVEFNPKRVGQYKLLGFEKHILQQEDFRNDAVDAAELAAAEAGVALYQFEAKPDGEGDVGTVSVRFRDLATGEMVEQRWPVPYEAHAQRPEQASTSIRLATAAAMLAARLRGEALGETVDLKTLSELMAGLSEQQAYDPRIQQLKLMIEQSRQLSEQ